MEANNTKSKVCVQNNNINNIKVDMWLLGLHSEHVSCLIETEKHRIISGSIDGSISICSIQYYKKTWNQDIFKKNAHSNKISSFCISSMNKLISCGLDKYIKIWNLSQTNMTLFLQLKTHTNLICKIISLTNNRLASSFKDGKVIIWKIQGKNKSNNLLFTLNHGDGPVNCIIQLKGKKLLVTCGISQSSYGVFFWSLKSYLLETHIQGSYTDSINGMIELSNGNIAISSDSSGYPIVVIDTTLYQIIYKLEYKCITDRSSLCILNENSFIYAYLGKLIQISNENGELLFFSDKNGFDGFYGGMISIEGGKYIAINYMQGVSIIKVFYN